jgi:ribose/xylose/arabinose/galactoside ABC-type transport system permease subunit
MGEFWPLGRLLIGLGALIILIGVVLLFSDKIPWVGRLPGDFHIKKDGFSFYFPLATSILISIILSLLFWLFRR